MAAKHRKSPCLIITILHIVTLMCQALTQHPMFAEPIPNVTVPLGRDVSLPCIIENLGTHKVAWIHVDRQMLVTIHKHVVAKIPRFSVTNDNHRRWLLNIRSVEQQDRGYYMCQINTNPMISQVGYLQVVVPPNILDSYSTESTIAVREHQNVTLTCKADGFPTPTLMWRREDTEAIFIERRMKVPKHEGEHLNLSKITRAEMGAYLCIASNGIPPTVSKRITVDVEFSPMIWVPNQLVGAPLETNVTIDCNTEAYPRAISYWIYNYTMVLSNEKYTTTIEENSYKTSMKLTIRSLKNGDFGNYRCISKNSLGETEGSIRLYEIPKPSAPPKATEIKSNANKEERKTTPVPPKRITTSWPTSHYSNYPEKTEKPPTREENIRKAEEKLRSHSTGSAYIIRWSAPQLMVVAVQYILTGTYIPPYVDVAVN
ncbi:lachesin-like isoform X2 [Leptopilina boulardi]|uniref:lachesin-like isoform X2 n=1 Tax=Leptopilina boulardi TaxID=63433 RepID=UPI0021F63323|nr:lachesin-like isoform X2 [Leptopilina boulardi]